MDALNSVPAPAVKRPVKRKAVSSKPKTPNATSQAQKLSPGHDASVSGEGRLKMVHLLVLHNSKCITWTQLNFCKLI